MKRAAVTRGKVAPRARRADAQILAAYAPYQVRSLANGSLLVTPVRERPTLLARMALARIVGELLAQAVAQARAK